MCPVHVKSINDGFDLTNLRIAFLIEGVIFGESPEKPLTVTVLLV
jgi:hypothetical protein